MIFEMIYGLHNIWWIITPTMVLDLAAIFLMISMTVYTASYRKRGKISDRIYFAMIILNMVSALLDGFNSVFEKQNADGSGYSTFILAGHSFYVMTYTITSLLLVLYLLAFYGKEDKIRKTGIILGVFVCILAILVVINLFTGWIFSVNDVTGAYEYGPLRIIIYVPAYAYALLSMLLLWKNNNRRLLFLIVFLVIARVILEIVFYEISTTPFVFAICLIYAHICMMNRSFYEEETT